MKTIYILILFLILLVLILRVCFVYSESLYIESEIDNNTYLIRRGKNKTNEYLKESADTLAEINNRVKKLVDYLYSKYKDDNSKSYFIIKLKENYNSSVLSEAAIDQRYTTYTIDKKDMHICLRTRDDHEKLYDMNLLMYVVLHELAHLCNYNRSGNPIQGHGIEFKQIFRLLVQEAINIGIYRYEDYVKKPKNYCGMVISSTIL
jgi:hypothetical protein